METKNDTSHSSSAQAPSAEFTRLSEHLLVQSVEEVFSHAARNASALPENAGRSFSDLFGEAEELRMHGMRAAVVARPIAERLGIPARDISLLEVACIVHDVGKMLIDTATAAGAIGLAQAIRAHVPLGRDLILTSFFCESHVTWRIADTVLSHHERWDGSGFPRRLKGPEIPLLARVLSIADAFDALVSTRGNMPALPVERAIQEIHHQRAIRFDPQCIDAFDAAIRQLQRDRLF